MIKKTSILILLSVLFLSPVFVFSATSLGGGLGGIGGTGGVTNLNGGLDSVKNTKSSGSVSSGRGLVAELTNPLGGQNQSLLDLITNLLVLVTRIGAIVCVLFIIWSGFLFIKAQGDPAEITKAKSVLLWSVVGTAVLLGASVIADLVNGTIHSVIGN